MKCFLCISTHNWPTAVRSSSETYLNQSVLPGEIIAANRQWAAKKGRFVCGARLMMNKRLTQKMMLAPGYKVALQVTPEIKKWYDGLRQHFLTAVNRFLQRGVGGFRYALGSNLAIWAEGLTKGNRHNDWFSSWGKQEYDLAVRHIKAGMKRCFLKFGEIVFHMYHPKSQRVHLQGNAQLHNQSIQEEMIYVESRMNKYLVAQ